MRLFDATLDLARYAQGVEQYKISSVLTEGKKFSCNNLSARPGEFTNGGTVWFLSGDSEGKFGSIMRGKDQNIETFDSFEDGFAAGDDVALSCFRYFNTQNLINGVNHVLYDYPIMAIHDGETDEAENYRHNQFEYQLPEDVTIDIRRVEIQCRNFHAPFPHRLPDTFCVCHYWHLEGRTLVIDPKHIYKWGGLMRIHYVKDHGAIYDPESQLISEQVDRNYLRKMANLWLWTHEIQMKHKDNPIAVDMFNQAKMDEENLGKKNIPESNLLPKDLCYFW